MKQRLLRFFHFGESDQFLSLITLILTAFGLVMVYSSSYIYAEERFQDGVFYFRKHLYYILFGFSFLFFFRFLRSDKIERLATPSFLFFMFFMILTLIPGVGVKVGGASRWLSIAGFSFQPVEFLKIAYVLFMAKIFNEFPPQNCIKKGFLNYLVPMLMVVFICLLQPDFGSSALFVLLTGLFLFNGGVKLKYLILSALASLPVLAGILWMAPYRRARLFAFLDPWSDPQGSGFQIIQSYLAFYRGGLFGVGLGNSKEKVFYLPKAHNDFVMAVVGEELGFIGVCLLMFGFLFLLYRGYKTALNADTDFKRLTAMGLSCLIGIEAFFSAGVTIGLLPTKGMNLPFISSGGSSLVSILIAIGILLSISVKVPKKSRWG